MKLFTLISLKQIQKIALTLSLVLFFNSHSFAQWGWNHYKGDSTSFKHRIIHHPNDTIYAHHINDSIFYHCRLDTAFLHGIHEWNDTIYFHFHYHFDSTFASNWRNRIDSIDSLRRDRFDSLRAHFHKFDTICAQHNWDTILNDSICMNHWFDTIIMHRHHGFVVFLHRVHLESDKKSLESDVMAAGSSNTTVSIPVSVNIYPNPIGENAILQIANSNDALSFRLFDVTGRVVMSMENLSNGAIELNRGNLSSGLYLYQVLNNNAIVGSGKVILQ